MASQDQGVTDYYVGFIEGKTGSPNCFGPRDRPGLLAGYEAGLEAYRQTRRIMLEGLEAFEKAQAAKKVE